MAITEADRLLMHEGLRECMKEKVADLLMEHLPPTGWADVARVQDLNQLEKVLAIQFSALNGRLDRMFQALLALAGATAAGFGVVAGIILTQR